MSKLASPPINPQPPNQNSQRPYLADWPGVQFRDAGQHAEFHSVLIVQWPTGWQPAHCFDVPLEIQETCNDIEEFADTPMTFKGAVDKARNYNETNATKNCRLIWFIVVRVSERKSLGGHVTLASLKGTMKYKERRDIQVLLLDPDGNETEGGGA